MNSLKAMYGCGLNFFIKLAYNSLFLYKFAEEKQFKRSLPYAERQRATPVRRIPYQAPRPRSLEQIRI